MTYLHDSVFTENITSILDKSSVKTDNIMVLGDLNYNLPDHHRHGKTLSEINDICPVYSLIQHVLKVIKAFYLMFF